jgi:hypothetical protein
LHPIQLALTAPTYVFTTSQIFEMADAMDVDAPAAGASKVAKGKTGGGKEGAERFQVKKVSSCRPFSHLALSLKAIVYEKYADAWLCFFLVVECRSVVGMGYRSRQLCDLQESHHGPLYAFSFPY